MPCIPSCYPLEGKSSSINILVNYTQWYRCKYFHVFNITAAAISGSKNHMIFSESPAAPGVPLVYRTPEDRADNPERLNLER